jgi:dienelactone hydrolase
MKSFRFWLVVFVPLAAVALLDAQFAPPAAKAPDEETLKKLTAKMEKLDQAGARLRKQSIPDTLLSEVEIYHKAAAWIIRHGEWYHADAAKWTDEVLDRGLLRAGQLGRGESPWLYQTGHDVVRAYRSRVDGSVQPYAVTAPADYGKEATRKWRLDVVLHGRDTSITEVKFLHQHNGDHATPKDQDFVRLDIFGRGNNAYRWAGESDVLEAVNNFLAVEAAVGHIIDVNRIVLRGFSMGGAGTWHLGLHFPSQWAAIGPGAGFTTTHGYIKDLPKLPAYQEACLHIYDAVDYAENAANVPVVAYSGDQDPQKAAADNIEKKLQALKIPMTHLVAPGLGHSFPAEWQKKAEEQFTKYVGPGKGLNEYPNKVRFVTYTLKYPVCSWVKLLALDKHYERAAVEAEKTDAGFTAKTVNVRLLALTLADPVTTVPVTVSIDGQQVTTRASRNQAGQAAVYLEKKNGTWQAILPQKIATDRQRQLVKMTNLQGPIDDAFMESFLCVRGTGKPWHAATQKYVEANLQRFRQEWSQYLRGELPVKDDVDVTDEDIAGKSLILFGDPASNALIAQVLDRLPLQWTKDSVGFAGKTASAIDHVPVLIYPSPLNSGRYVVLNSGHTFHAADFKGTNALLYPRLGDYALLKLAGTDKDPLAAETVTAGLFDDSWQLRKD